MVSSCFLFSVHLVLGLFLRPEIHFHVSCLSFPWACLSSPHTLAMLLDGLRAWTLIALKGYPGFIILQLLIFVQMSSDWVIMSIIKTLLTVCSLRFLFPLLFLDLFLFYYISHVILCLFDLFLSHLIILLHRVLPPITFVLLFYFFFYDVVSFVFITSSFVCVLVCL